MDCSELKVVSLNITEDNYEYKSLFRLCTGKACFDVDIEKLSEEGILEEIKKCFDIAENVEEMKTIIMEKINESIKLESRINEGESCCGDITEDEERRSIDSLSMS